MSPTTVSCLRYSGVFLGVGVLAPASWSDASLSQMISLRDPFLEFKPWNLKEHCTLTNVFFFVSSGNPVWMLLKQPEES